MRVAPNAARRGWRGRGQCAGAMWHDPIGLALAHVPGRRDAEVLSAALQTDMLAFRKLALAEPLVIELREWSRMTDRFERRAESALQSSGRATVALFSPVRSKIETIVESGDCLGRGVALRVVLRYS